MREVEIPVKLVVRELDNGAMVVYPPGVKYRLILPNKKYYNELIENLHKYRNYTLVDVKKDIYRVKATLLKGRFLPLQDEDAYVFEPNENYRIYFVPLSDKPGKYALVSASKHALVFVDLDPKTHEFRKVVVELRKAPLWHEVVYILSWVPEMPNIKVEKLTRKI